ncbi:zinc/manganese transport system substrate-binding protein [Weissella beninensis]|uniref:Zinc ABC transporter substrate-binding protein n=1 Tax=Periweissella beninensis TaxID=504936 RepID=A0ABT0VII2_9LACO|nr:zinc ABC transporter substrate-binding protein [Periweissella beninensis]MBM7543914.1 zinc/manganese transport system substrate-binding protein [Periweissella beninensis]MCM2437640.1 zinc ABC transporter substrate-binding protein [Periweissella beninensis]
MRDKIKIKWLLGVICLVLVLAGCSGVKTKNSTKQINVVATTDFYAQVAQTVLGKHGTATAIIHNSSVSPEEYEAKPATAKLVAQADLVVANGLGYDSWLSKLVKATGQPDKEITVGQDVLKQPMGSNPHVWNNPQNMIKLAKALATKFSKMDKKHAREYQQNAQKYINQLKPVTQLLKQLTVNGQHNQVIVSEPVYNLMLQALGYQVVNAKFAMAVEEGNDPTPQVYHQLQKQIKKHQVQFLVENTQSTSNIVKQVVTLAKKNNLPIVKVTETLPTGLDYVSWQLQNLRQIEKIQKE